MRADRSPSPASPRRAVPDLPPERWSRQRLFRVFRRGIRPLWMGLLARGAPPGDAPLPEPAALGRVLLVFVNFRLGNNLLVTPAIDAIARGLVASRIDLLVAPGAVRLFEGLGAHRVHVLGRFDSFRPIRFLRLLRRLRRARYDAAIELGGSAQSLGAMWVGLSGARHRIGPTPRGANVYFTSLLPAPASPHKVDQVLERVRALGIPAEGERRLALSEEERAWGRAELARRFPDGPSRVVGLFVGGRARKGKDWPLDTFACLVAALRAESFGIAVFLGPEEASLRAEIATALAPASLVEERSLRRVAALAAACRAVVAPDSGPMHLSIAAGAPTVALFRKPNHERWGPKPSHGEIVLDPAGRDWRAIAAAVLRVAGPADARVWPPAPRAAEGREGPPDSAHTDARPDGYSPHQIPTAGGVLP